MRFLKYFQVLLLAATSWSAIAAGTPLEPLVWESDNLTNQAKLGDISSRFTFRVTNVSDADFYINDLKTSCGCTVATLPSKPWKLAPKESGKVEAIVDLRGKHGELRKEIAIFTTNVPKALKITVLIPEGSNDLSPEMSMRLWGQQLAGVDRQAVFKTDCVKCHLVPAFGKSGEQLFHVSCGICHEAKNRASMVPDLSTLKTEITPDYWRNMVANGKPGTLMPGFAATNGGPLDDAQMDGLAKYLAKTFPRPIKK